MLNIPFQNDDWKSSACILEWWWMIWCEMKEILMWNLLFFLQPLQQFVCATHVAKEASSVVQPLTSQWRARVQFGKSPLQLRLAFGDRIRVEMTAVA